MLKLTTLAEMPFMRRVHPRCCGRRQSRVPPRRWPR